VEPGLTFPRFARALFFPCRRFSPTEDISGSVAMKSSAVRAVKKAITDLYPTLEPFIDDIIPKKENVMEAKG
jgi:PUA domain protein